MYMFSAIQADTVQRPQAWRTRALLGLATLVCVLLSGCASNRHLQALSEQTKPLADDASLLSGAAVFGVAVTPFESRPPDLLEMHPAMPNFIATVVGTQPATVVRLKSVLKALGEQAYFSDSYVADATQTAGKTFAEKRGNCLSYTAMFVVLSRLAGLEVNFQVVNVPPAWIAGSDYLVRSTHINAVASDIRMSHNERLDLTVDFNSVTDTERYRSRQISDAYANSLFLANLGVQHLQAGNNLEGFRHLRAGIELEPTNIDLWVNLAAFYATHQAPKQAQAAYLKALRIDPSSRAVHAGLGRTYEKLQRPELAQQHLDLARQYQAKNPYYHFSIAQRALGQADYTYALEAVNRALQLSGADGSFHYLKAITLQHLGDPNGAQRSLDKAQRLGTDPGLLQRYPLTRKREIGAKEMGSLRANT